MSGYKYPAKNARVSLYREKRVKVKAEGASSYKVERQSLHPGIEKLRAYCNPIAPNVSSHDTAEFARQRVLVVINFIPGVATGDKVQWGDRRMKIVLPPDDFEGRHLELKLTCETEEADL